MGIQSFFTPGAGGQLSGIQKAAGWLGKLAPIVGGIASLIPNPVAQGIASAANIVGQVTNGPSAQQQAAPPAEVPVPATQAATAGSQLPPGTAPPPGPVM